jgi:hypothetical protein
VAKSPPRSAGGARCHSATLVAGSVVSGPRGRGGERPRGAEEHGVAAGINEMCSSPVDFPFFLIFACCKLRGPEFRTLYVNVSNVFYGCCRENHDVVNVSHVCSMCFI